jgi:hypothetical protein
VDLVGALAAVVVGITFVAAGVLKLADLPAWTRQASDLRVPAPAARALPLVEIVVGATLAVLLAEPWPALAAIVLLVAFEVVIVLRLRDGARPPCACFGSRSTTPLGARHLARNAVLLALATVAAIWA